VGLWIVVVLCAVIFAILAASLPNRGATPEKIAASRPGDELVAQPAILWNHAITLKRHAGADLALVDPDGRCARWLLQLYVC
jgi:predicted MFS family arabinose efflux permease